jgi:hypothetical protein
MTPLVLAALLPGLFWDQGVETAPRLKSAGISRIYTPAARVAAWKAAGIEAAAFTPGEGACVEAETPRLQLRMDVASATNMPWIDSNGWRIQREPGKKWCYKAEESRPSQGRGRRRTAPAQSEGVAALAAAEAYSFAADAVIAAGPAELAEFGRMLGFLARIDRPPMPELANFGIVDDGSDLTAEVLNLMTRRNLLYRVLQAPDPTLDLNLRPKDVADPYAYALEARRTLGDDKRLVRLYGSDVVIARLTGEGNRARLHLLNYSRRPVLGLRVRVLRDWRGVSLDVFGQDRAQATDISRRDGATEFTVPEMGPYAVAGLDR